MHKNLLSTVLLFLLSTAAVAQEMEVDGDLKVTGNIIFNDATTQGTAAAPSAPGMNGVAEFMSSTTWTVPDGISRIRIILIGAGGGGQCNSGDQGCSTGGAGGGAGGYVNAVINVTSGQSMTLTIGNGGEGACENVNGGIDYLPGDNGEDSSVSQNGTILVVANGGAGGASGTGGPGGAASINNGTGITRNGGEGQSVSYGTDIGGTGGAVSALGGATFGRGNGGKGSTCGAWGNSAIGQDGQSGYLLMYW